MWPTVYFTLSVCFFIITTTNCRPVPLKLKSYPDSNTISLTTSKKQKQHAGEIRCGKLFFPEDEDNGIEDMKNMKRDKRFVKHREHWNKTMLQWKFSDPHRLFQGDEDKKIVSSVIREALRLWQKASRGILEFVETKSRSKVDLEVYFAVGDHYDHEAFDGIGGVVAHTGYPMAGKVHFDASEVWTVSGETGVDLRYVTLHELGHALGLRHSTNHASIMYPIYRRNVAEVGLSNDDIHGIRSLYPKRTSSHRRIQQQKS